MSDEHAHDDGAHEIDKMPAGRLFNIVVILGGLTLALCLGVIQLFNLQVRNIEGERVSKGYATQQEYLAEMASIAEGYGKFETTKSGGEGKPDVVTTRYYIPLEKAEQQVLDNPALLKGQRPSRGWEQTNTGKKVEEWGGMPGATPKAPTPAAKAPDRKRGAAADDGPRDHRFAFAVSGDQLVLLGEVPSEAASKAIEAAAKKTHFGENVRNKLKVTDSTAKPEFEAAWKRGIAAVDLMSTGAVKWTSGKLAIEGFVPQADEAKLTALTKREGTAMGEIDISTTETADACDAKFARALKKPITFDEGGATIDEKSSTVLDKLASLVKECPGRILVEGHTGTQGEADANKQLSLQRANAVSTALQERGVERGRLRGKGFGGERPLDDGDGDAAQKKNARIEMRIAR